MQAVDGGSMQPTQGGTHMDSAHRLARDVLTRATVVIGLAGIALIHLLDAVGKFSETPYIAWMYIGLIVGSLGAAALLIGSRSKSGFAAAAALAAAAIAAYILNRTVGLPHAHEDIGNWTEPLGMAALFVEGCVVAVSVFALRSGNRLTGEPFRRDPVPA